MRSAVAALAAAGLAMTTAQAMDVPLFEFHERAFAPPPPYGRRRTYRRDGSTKRRRPWFKGSSVAKAGARAAAKRAKTSERTRLKNKRWAAIMRGLDRSHPVPA